MLFQILKIPSARPASPYCKEYVYIYISDFVDTVDELAVPPNNTASEVAVHRSGGVRSFLGILLGRMPGGDWAHM